MCIYIYMICIYIYMYVCMICIYHMNSIHIATSTTGICQPVPTGHLMVFCSALLPCGSPPVMLVGSCRFLSPVNKYHELYIWSYTSISYLPTLP